MYYYLCLDYRRLHIQLVISLELIILVFFHIILHSDLRSMHSLKRQYSMLIGHIHRFYIELRPPVDSAVLSCEPVFSSTRMTWPEFAMTSPGDSLLNGM